MTYPEIRLILTAYAVVGLLAFAVLLIFGRRIALDLPT